VNKVKGIFFPGASKPEEKKHQAWGLLKNVTACQKDI
jgi:hypothetical protein